MMSGLGVSEVQWYRVYDCTVNQPCLTIWSATLPSPSCLRPRQRESARSHLQQQAEEMECLANVKRAAERHRRPALRSLRLSTRQSDTQSLGTVSSRPYLAHASADGEAQLYQLYLNPSNTSLLQRLYIAPCSSNPFVQMTIAYQLRRAAETELVKASASNVLVEDDIMKDAEEAFEALASLLGEDDQWFFGQEKPGLFDASVFAYTHLLLDEAMRWQENRLGSMLEKYENLVKHQERVVEMYFT